MSNLFCRRVIITFLSPGLQPASTKFLAEFSPDPNPYGTKTQADLDFRKSLGLSSDSDASPGGMC